MDPYHKNVVTGLSLFENISTFSHIIHNVKNNEIPKYILFQPLPSLTVVST